MAKVITCGLIKGGTGKTTIVRNLAHALFREGKRVCMIDLDPQSNLTISCGIDKPADLPITIANLLEMEADCEELPRMDDYLRSSDGVDFIPSSKYLSAVRTMLTVEAGGNNILSGITDRLRPYYDYILLDISPSEDILTTNALCASDSILIPMDLQVFAYAGLSDIITAAMKLRRRTNPKLTFEGIVFNRYDTRCNLSQWVVDDVTTTYGEQVHIFHSAIPQTVYIGEAHYCGLPIGVHKPNSNAALAFQQLAAEVLEHNGEIRLVGGAAV